MRFFVVTPCQSVDAALLRTVESVRSQDALLHTEHSISYHLQCNNLTPGLFDSFSKQYPDTANFTLTIKQATDNGIYDALAIAFQQHEDEDAFCYLGAGDQFSPHALSILSQTLSDSTPWLTGLICGLNNQGHMIECQPPYYYRRNLIKAGLYGKLLPFIQQESTFWNQDLHHKLDWQAIRECKYAGDALIWHQLADHSSLTIVEAWLGGFERRIGQISERHKEDYLRELQAISNPSTLQNKTLALIDWIVWRMPRTVKRRLNKHRFIYDHALEKYTLNSRK